MRVPATGPPSLRCWYCCVQGRVWAPELRVCAMQGRCLLRCRRRLAPASAAVLPPRCSPCHARQGAASAASASRMRCSLCAQWACRGCKHAHNKANARPAACRMPAMQSRRMHALCRNFSHPWVWRRRTGSRPARRVGAWPRQRRRPAWEQQRVAWCAWANQGTIFMQESGAPGARQR